MASPSAPVAPSPVVDGEAPAELLPSHYAALRRLARARLAAGGRYTLLDTTALVHESYLRLRSSGVAVVNDSEHFLAYAAATMRSIVVDYVRRRLTARQGGGAVREPLDTGFEHALPGSDEEVLEIHDALEVLGRSDARLAQVVELRYFCGLTDAEVASALGVTDRTVRRDWERARLLLAEMLGH